MRNEIIVAAIVAMLIIGVGIGYLGRAASQITKTETSTVTSISTRAVTVLTDTQIACTPSAGIIGAPSNGGLPLAVGNNLYRCERVLVIPSGSTGTLEVSYQTDPSAVAPRSAGGTSIANLTARVLVPEVPPIITFPEQFTYTNATGVTVTSSPGSVNVTRLGKTNFTATYTISASPGVRGFYELEYLDACPSMIPLAVGYAPSQVNASSFPDYQPFSQGCYGPAMLPGGTLLSVNGIQTAWLVQAVEQQSSTTG